MKRKRQASESSNDEELLAKKSKSTNLSSKMKELLKEKVETCQICDRVFQNRYDILVHNAEHIIIPLIREPQCLTCGLWFGTKDELTIHTELRHKVPDIFKKLFKSSEVHYDDITESLGITESDKNKKLIKTFIDKEAVVKCDDSLTELIIKNNEKKLGHIVNKKAIVKCDDSVTELIMESNEKKLEKIVKKDAVVACDTTLTKLIIGSKSSNSFKDKIIESNDIDFINKQAIVKCDDSINELIMERNEKKLEKIVKKDAIVACDNTLTKLIIGSKSVDSLKDTELKNNEKTLDNIVNKQAIVKCDDTVTELIMESNEKKLEKIVKKDAIVSCDNSLNKLIIGSKVCKDLDKQDYIDDDICIISDDEDDSIVPVNNDENNKNISSRLLFENDFDDDLIKFNNIYEAKVIDINNDGSKLGDDDEEYIIPDEVPVLVKQVAWTPSVHYEDLIENKEHKCKICSTIFPNRYELLIHEVAHIKMKTSPPKALLCIECERYIAGNHYSLRFHMAKKHANVTPRKRPLKNCEKCRLKYYNPIRHHNNYHQIYLCHVCHNHFSVETERDSHEAICRNTKEPHYIAPPDIEVKKDLKVCEMCSLFFKYKPRMKYVCTGKLSKPGVRIPCEYCGKMFFEVKLFKMIPKQANNLYQKQKFSNNMNIGIIRSNEERLKNIKKRLSILNKLSRC